MKNKNELFAQVVTTSNYRKTNYEWLKVLSISGRIVKCEIPIDSNNDFDEGSSEFINADFGLDEIYKFNYFITK